MNIILIGFKHCGKSTLGRHIAEAWGLEFVDTDALLEERYLAACGENLDCRAIYRKLGAERMRELEMEALASALLGDGVVVSTGGGVVLNPLNLPLLRDNGVCVFIDTPLEQLEKRLEPHLDSPLFASKSVAQLHTERYPLYLKAARIRLALQGRESPDEIAARLKEILEKMDG